MCFLVHSVVIALVVMIVVLKLSSCSKDFRDFARPEQQRSEVPSGCQNHVSVPGSVDTCTVIT